MSKKQILVQLSTPNRIELGHFDFDDVLNETYLKSILDFVLIFTSQLSLYYWFLFYLNHPFV